MIPNLRGNRRDGRRLRICRIGDGVRDTEEKRLKLGGQVRSALVGDGGGTVPRIELTAHYERQVSHAQR